MTGEGYTRAMAWQACQRALSLAAIAAGLLVCAVTPGLAERGKLLHHLQKPRPDLCLPGRRPEARGRATRSSSIASSAPPRKAIMPPARRKRNSPAATGWRRSIAMTARCRRIIASDPRIKQLHRQDQTRPADLREAEGRPAQDAGRTRPDARSTPRGKGLRNARGALGGSSQEVDQSLPDEPLPLDQSPRRWRPRAPRRECRRPSQPRPASRQRGRRFRAQELSLRGDLVPQVQRRDRRNSRQTHSAASGFAATRGPASAPRRSDRPTSRAQVRPDGPRQSWLPRAAARLNHLWATTRSAATSRPVA